MKPLGHILRIIPLLLLSAPSFGAAAPLQSGPQPGQKPLPFTSNLVTGPYRGQQHCYICDMVDQPAVLVFLRSRDDGPARLLKLLRDAVRDHRKEKLFGWVVFLGPPGAADESALERESFNFARANDATSLAVSALGDPLGPPGYRIAPDAQATIILFRSGKVVFNHAYSAHDWTAHAAEGSLSDLPDLLKSPAGG